MLDGLFMLLSLSLVMALASFLAGGLPLTLSLSSSQLRMISAVGMGVLVGTSLIVVIPEGIEAVYSAGSTHAGHTMRSVFNGSVYGRKDVSLPSTTGLLSRTPPNAHIFNTRHNFDIRRATHSPETDASSYLETNISEKPYLSENPRSDAEGNNDDVHQRSPNFGIGLSLSLGFVLMFLIDRLPQHASENLRPAVAPREISLNNLSGGVHVDSNSAAGDESVGFLRSFAASRKQGRSLATTLGLVIHAAADGIALGASASSSDTELGLVIFAAIMLHKAPAAFGLTSVLLKQGLSKRAARGHLIVFSLAAPLGALITWTFAYILAGGAVEDSLTQWWTGMLLLFSAGTFLYVAMHAMQEDSSHHDGAGQNGHSDGYALSQRKQSHPQIKETCAAVAGMLVPLLTQMNHNH